MRYYLIIVEGAHDIATVERILRLHGINRMVRHKSEVPDVWKRMIPEKYPFHADDLERITPVPSFWQNDEISVAIKNAGSDMQLVNCIKEMCYGLKIYEKQHLEKIMLIGDADRKPAEEKRRDILGAGDYDDDFRILENGSDMVLQLEELAPKEHILLPLVMYVLPDNENSGTLEDLLLDAAEIVYPDLKECAEHYINTTDSERYKEMSDTTKRNKATVGCIANVIKPGKANQAAIADSEWIGDISLCSDKIKKLYKAVGDFLDIKEIAE